MSARTASSSRPRSPSNTEIAAVLDRVAELLDVQHASPHRVRAYREAARTLRALDRSAAAMSRAELEELPRIGERLAAAVDEISHKGRLAMLDRLEGQLTPEEQFATVPGLGPVLARRVHDELGVDTLEELELAAHDGRLERLPGVGPRRALALRDVLGAMLRRSARSRARLVRDVVPHEAAERPGVDVLLDVDREYRRRAAEGSLRLIAPRRFNPKREAWLPVLHEERAGWSFTALFSNTARAHELGRTRDWVVLYHERDGDEGQCTVVTETQGALAGRRVVRGREAECARYYEASEARPAPAPAQP